jgi:predicted  nucleic acid-binding Zn-ribbon protein
MEAALQAAHERARAVTEQLKDSEAQLGAAAEQMAELHRQLEDVHVHHTETVTNLREELGRSQRSAEQAHALVQARQAELERLHQDNDGLGKALREASHAKDALQLALNSLELEAERLRNALARATEELAEARQGGSARQRQADELGRELNRAAEAYESEIARLKVCGVVELLLKVCGVVELLLAFSLSLD